MYLHTMETMTLSGIKLIQQRECEDTGYGVWYGPWEYFVNGRQVRHWKYERIEDEQDKGVYTERYSIQDEVIEI